MVNNTMDNNSKTVRVLGTRYRTIPNFGNYGVSSLGEVINLTTRQVIMPFEEDSHHWSGRVSLYRRDKHGNRIKRTFNILDLMKMVYSENYIRAFENMYGLVSV